MEVINLNERTRGDPCGCGERGEDAMMIRRHHKGSGYRFVVATGNPADSGVLGWEN